MKIPPLLIAAAAAFWGVESGNLILGVICASIIGGVTVIPTRWDLSDDDCVRISDLTSVIFLSAAALILLNVETVVFLKTVVIWQPLVLLLLVCAQLYSKRENIIIGTRFGLKKNGIYKHNPLDFKIYYLAVCLLSAAMANSRSLLFFPGAALIFLWLLLENRGRAHSPIIFITIFLIALGGGYLFFKGAESVHRYVTAITRQFYRGYFYARYSDPFQANLSFGKLGRLKTSGEIILRIKTAERPPTLLRQASYELFQKDLWHSNQSFQYLPITDSMWRLSPAPDVPGRRSIIEFYLPKEKGLLPHPYGSYQTMSETIYELEQKEDGIIRIVDGAPLITYDIWNDPSLSQSTEQPSRRNLTIPAEENRVLDKVTEGWQLEAIGDKEKVKKVMAFFTDGFTYSLDLKGAGNFDSPLENFLRGSREGYCELFATATTLLLRKVGIPSRYVTGFAVSEKSWLEDKYIVRERHAHAWSEAFIDGSWTVVDTTPPDWLNRDRKNRSAVEPIMDLISYLKLKYNQFRIQTEQNYRPVLSVIVVVLATILIFRIYRRMTAKQVAEGTVHTKRTFKQIDSPMYLVEQRLVDTGVGRSANEPFLDWAKRINAKVDIDLTTLEKLVELHRRLRFDPAGIAEEERRYLNGLADEWLAHYDTMGKQELYTHIK